MLDMIKYMFQDVDSKKTTIKYPFLFCHIKEMGF